MYHTHFNTIHSTQIYLRDNLVDLKGHSDQILISASEQTLGIGRKGSHWDTYSNSIAMSFTMKPNMVPTLTPIEVGILISAFLKKEFDATILLKWPNDLLTSKGNKCGGIIAQYIDSETVIVGLGLNLGNVAEAIAPGHYKHGLGNISDAIHLTANDQKEIPVKLYEYLNQSRIESVNVMQSQFSKNCYHIGLDVMIDDDGFNHQGKFLGIGKNGEALVEIDGITRSFISSSLKILS